MPDTLQRVIGVIAAATTLPLLALLGAVVKLDSPGPALYAGLRVGSGGSRFRCHKLRTMRVDAEAGPAITSAGDARITRFGRTLRRLRLDELPQLWDVARGEMRLVGPRPEAPEFVDPDDPLQRVVLSARPGITGLAQLYFADEAAWLDERDPATSYRDKVLPRKLRYDMAYVRHRSTRLDLWILAATPRTILTGRPPGLPRVLQAEVSGG